MLSLYKLEIFNAVAKEGSFSKAAERLLLTQPAVSQHVRDLENSLGRELFIRGNRGVTLTTAGETLLDYTRCILRMVADAEAALVNLDELENGQLAVGATPGAGVYLLPEWVQSFYQRFPGVSVSLRTDTTAGIAQEILNSRLDLGIVEGEIKVESPLNMLVLREIDLYVVVGAAQPGWEREALPVEELDGLPFVSRPAGSQTRAWIDTLFAQHGISPRIIAEFDNPEAIKQAVASGMGLSILPDWSIRDAWSRERLRILRLENLTLRRTLKLLWKDGLPLRPAGRSFLSLLSNEFPQLAQLVTAQDLSGLNLPRREEYKASLNLCVGQK